MLQSLLYYLQQIFEKYYAFSFGDMSQQVWNIRRLQRIVAIFCKEKRNIAEVFSCDFNFLLPGRQEKSREGDICLFDGERMRASEHVHYNTIYTTYIGVYGTIWRCAQLMYMCAYKTVRFVAAHCSRIAREIGECPRNNLCCWARATSDVPYLDARSALIRRWTVSHRMAREYKEEGRDVSACRSASLSCRRQTRPLWFVYMAGEVPPSRKGKHAW